MPLTDNIALVSLTSTIPTSVFLQVAAALQKQVTRDFTPAWGIPATVNAFADFASVPSDYHVVIVFGDSAELRRGREHAQDGRFVFERADAPRAGLLDDVRRAAAGRGDEDAVAARDVDDGEVVLDDGARLDKTQRQEIVGNL